MIIKLESIADTERHVHTRESRAGEQELADMASLTVDEKEEERNWVREALMPNPKISGK